MKIIHVAILGALFLSLAVVVPAFATGPLGDLLMYGNSGVTWGWNQPALRRTGNAVVGLFTHDQQETAAMEVWQNNSFLFRGRVDAGANQDVFTFNNEPGPVHPNRNLMAFQESGKTVASITSGGGATFSGYLQLIKKTTPSLPPPSADCDESSEIGRMVLDPTQGQLYICIGASGGWIGWGHTDIKLPAAPPPPPPPQPPPPFAQ